jgi:hypothetical protein
MKRDPQSAGKDLNTYMEGQGFSKPLEGSPDIALALPKLSMKGTA